MLLAELVRVGAVVAETPKRTEKVAALASLLRQATAEEIPTVIGLLLGSPRQGRVGVGWSTLSAALDLESSVTKSDHSTDESHRESSLTIHDVDALFAALAVTAGAGSQSTRFDLLQAAFSKASAAEREFLRRVFTGEMRQGANAGVVTDAVAKAAGKPLADVRRVAMLLGDLGDAAQLILGGGDLESVGLTPLVGVQPMLASTATSVAAALASVGPASVEFKLDGARVQVHRDGASVRVFTRTLNDISTAVPEVVAAALSISADRFVLDGEALGLDADGNPLAFQDSMSGTAQLRPFFFDILFGDGRSLVDVPLRERKRVMDQLVPSTLRLPTLDIEAVDAESSAMAAQFAAQALAEGHEGVMVKGLDSPYQAGRRGKTWLKVKPVHTFDLVVLAVEWGHGRRTGLLSNLHLGARARDGSFVMVGKTFKGLTDELLRWQTTRFCELATSDNGWVVTVRPEQVVEIAIDGVQRSTRYPGGVALRFARVKRYRDDKLAADADPIERFQEML
jgi:DNA ligase 1